ncbi:MAG: FtsX-like permease family protein, partial [Bacteroidota bacterium]|nr:FtsX-like permease family protein [Bacteroidota bacterium]
INFVNLFIANASKQLRNMGIVKVHGASRVQTLKHLLLEISIMILFSILVALTLVQFLHPYFEALAGKAVPSLMESGWTFALILLGIVMATTFLAGIFPSFLISSVQPSKIIKNELTVGQSGKKLKNGLVVFQFVVSIFLIVGTITSEKQLNYMNRFDTGYNKENVLVLPLQTQELQQKIDLLKEELNQMSLVKNVSAVSEVPYNGLAMNGYFPEGRTTPEMINVIDVDEDFLALLDISMVSGNNFAKNMATDDNSYLVNESFVKKMGWENPIGKTITRNGEHKIIGVVKDFNFASLRSNINPLIITNASEIGPPNFLLVKSDRANLSQLIGDIENKWKAISPNSLFEYQFLDQQFEKVYRAELSIQKLLRSFSFLTILVALLGLLGLSRSSINNRIKEIGIRKVNGASSREVLALLNKDYVKLILLSFLIAVPLAWYAMHKWLESFAYQTSLSWWIFALAGGITLLVALLTVSWQTIKASRTNPANSLKTE